LGATNDLFDHWQLIADSAGYPSAEALAWSAMAYIEITHGSDVVIELANAFLTQRVGNSLLAAFQDRRSPVKQRFEKVTGSTWSNFSSGWNAWLDKQVLDDAVLALRDRLPAVNAQVESETDSGGIHRLLAGYSASDRRGASTAEALSSLTGECIMKHDLLGPFDTEFEVRDDATRTSACELGDSVHVVGSRYAPGDRVYVALEYESDSLHQPLRLYSERLHVQ